MAEQGDHEIKLTSKNAECIISNMPTSVYRKHPLVESLRCAVQDCNFLLMQQIVPQLKTEDLWKPEDIFTIALEVSSECHHFRSSKTKSILEYFISEGAVPTSKCLQVAVEHGDASLVRFIIHLLKFEYRWDATDRAVTSALDKAFATLSHFHHYQMADLKYLPETIALLVFEGALLSQSSIVESDLQLTKHFRATKLDTTDSEVTESRYEFVNDSKQKCRYLIDFLLSEGSALTSTGLLLAAHNGNITMVKSIIQHLKSAGEWKPEDPNITFALLHAFLQDFQDIIDLLISEGTIVTPTILQFAIRHGNVASTACILHRMKTEGSWHPEDLSITSALIEVYKNQDSDMIALLTSEGAAVTTAGLSMAAKVDKNIMKVKSLIEYIKTEGNWNPNHIHITAALKESLLNNSIFIRKLLVSEGAVITSALLPLAAKNGDINLVKSTIQHLKTAGRWNAKEESVHAVFEESLKHQSNDITDFLISEGVKVTSAALPLAVKNGNISHIKSIIQHLKTESRWNVKDDNTATALEMSFQQNSSSQITKYLISEGAIVTLSGIPLAAKHGQTAVLRTTLQYMKTKGNVNFKDHHVSVALTKALKDELYNIVDLLVAEGAIVTLEGLPLAVKYGNTSLVQATINHLKATNKLNSKDINVSTALEEALTQKSHDVIELLVAEGGTVSLHGFPLAAEYGDITLVKSAIENLKEVEEWDSQHMSISFAIEKAIRSNAEDIVNLLMYEGATFTTATLLSAVKYGTANMVQSTIQYLIAGGNWNSNDPNISASLEESVKIHSCDIVELLVSSGAIISTLNDGGISVVKSAIQELKLVKKWNPKSSAITEALETTLEQINSGRPPHCQMNYIDTAHLLISEGAVVTRKYLLSAIQSSSTHRTRTAEEMLRSDNKWDPYNPDIVAVLEKTFGDEMYYPQDLDKNPATEEMSQVPLNMYLDHSISLALTLISCGVPVTKQCLLSAMRTGAKHMVRIAIEELKSAKKWDPTDPDIIAALEETFKHKYLEGNEFEWSISDVKIQDVNIKEVKEVILLLLSSGVPVTKQNLISIVRTFNSEMMEAVVAGLKSANKWDPTDPDIIAALEETFEHKYSKEHKQCSLMTTFILYKIRYLLVASGVPVTTKCLLSAITSEDIHSVEFSIHRLKAAGRWDPGDENINAAVVKLLQLKYNPLYAQMIAVFEDIQALLLSSGVPVTEAAMLLAMEHEDSAFIKAAIPNWTKVNSQQINAVLEKAKMTSMYEVVELISAMKQKSLHHEAAASSAMKNIKTRENTSSIFTKLYEDTETLKSFLGDECKSLQEQLGWLLANHLDAKLLEQSNIILEHICLLLKGENCVSIYPAYKPEEKWTPVIVKLENTFRPSQWDKCIGIDIFTRRYDEVSQEASKVMNDPEVQEHLLSMADMERIRNAIKSSGLTKKHSNITLISSCPYKARKEGKEKEKCLCIVIHCLVKGLIPFGEEPFPKEIDGIPVDVREGYCVFGMRNSDDDGDFPMDEHPVPEQLVPQFQALGLNPPNLQQQAAAQQIPALHNHPPKGNKSSEYNRKLLMGAGICLSSGGGKGTLGGFVRLADGSIGFLTCAHVVVPDVQGSPDTVSNHTGIKVSQPAHDDIEVACNLHACECGELVKHLFDPGATDRIGIDAALVKITDQSRIPHTGDFIFVNKAKTKFAGFDPTKPPNFNTGSTITFENLTEEQKRISVVKYGSETELTVGPIHQNGIYARQVTREMKLPDGRPFEFHNQVEILSIVGASTTFFDLGDSGSLVFLPLSTGLHCVGMAIGVTSYKSCLVTPIEEIFERLGVEFVVFSRT